jgi:magnesium-transporting ATPase (P-type)
MPNKLALGLATSCPLASNTFTVLVLAQLFNCFNARSETRSAWHGLFANHWLWAAVLLSAGLQVAVVHVPLLNEAFGTAPLTLLQWGVCVAMASGVLWFSECRKWVIRVWWKVR